MISGDQSPQWATVLGLMTLQTPRLAVPTLQETEASGNTWDVDVAQQLLGGLAGGDSLPDISLPDVLHPEACPDRLVHEE